MKAKDIMTKNVATISPSATIAEAAQMMQKHNIGAIPVCDTSGVVGIVTDRDIVVRNVTSGKNPQQTPVTDVMTCGVKTVSADTEMDEVTRIMSNDQIRRIPVMENNQIVGIVALGDVATGAKYDTEVADTLTEISQPTKMK
jgi:CBS domain-containing protein